MPKIASLYFICRCVLNIAKPIYLLHIAVSSLTIEIVCLCIDGRMDISKPDQIFHICAGPARIRLLYHALIMLRHF